MDIKDIPESVALEIRAMDNQILVLSVRQRPSETK